MINIIVENACNADIRGIINKHKGMSMKKTISSLAILIGMVGCGGTSTTAGIGTGYYIDSAVEGVSYHCGNQEGTTDSKGMFKFESAQACQFSINGKVFKTVAADRLIDEVVIQEDDEKIAQFLMTLDKDGDADNGIVITPSVAQKVTKIPQSSADFALLNTELASVDGYSGKYVSPEEAKAHLAGVVDIVAVASVASDEIVEGEAVVLNASESTISKGEISSYTWKEGSQILGTGVRLSKSDFAVGAHTVTLTVSDDAGHTKSDDVSFTIVEKTKWAGITPLSSNGDKKLYVTSDENNLYFKLDAGELTQDGIFYINSDDNNISGLTTMGIWPNGGFDYAIKSNGLYQLQGASDFDGVLVYDQNYTVNNNILEFAIAKSHFAYLAKKIGVGVIFPTEAGFSALPDASVVEKFTDTYHDNNQSDHVPPIITVEKATMLVDGNYTKPTATAYDVFDAQAVSVSTDDSDVKPTVPGFYNVFFTAKDSAGNEANASTVVEVRGESATKHLEEKSLTARGQKVIIDPSRKLVWTSDDTPIPTGGSMSDGCLFIGEGNTKEEAQTNFENFCKNSHYAGLTGWRAASPDELSRFIVQAKQEGIMPGMGKSGCVQTIAVDVDNGGLKSVWTRKKPSVNDATKLGVQAGFIDSEFAFPAGGRCVRGAKSQVSRSLISNDNEGKQGEDKTIEDTDTNLIWVNEFAASKKACLAIHHDKPADYNKSIDFCQNLTYAGSSDWRDPTPAELSAYVQKTNDEHIFIGFEAPCKKLLARERDANGTIISEKEVYTRYNGSKLAQISDFNSSTNIGLRCVHNK